MEDIELLIEIKQAQDAFLAAKESGDRDSEESRAARQRFSTLRTEVRQMREYQQALNVAAEGTATPSTIVAPMSVKEN